MAVKTGVQNKARVPDSMMNQTAKSHGKNAVNTKTDLQLTRDNVLRGKAGRNNIRSASRKTANDTPVASIKMGSTNPPGRR